MKEDPKNQKRTSILKKLSNFSKEQKGSAYKSTFSTYLLMASMLGSLALIFMSSINTPQNSITASIFLPETSVTTIVPYIIGFTIIIAIITTIWFQKKKK
jgi:hypothetical protein